MGQWLKIFILGVKDIRIFGVLVINFIQDFTNKRKHFIINYSCRRNSCLILYKLSKMLPKLLTA